MQQRGTTRVVALPRRKADFIEPMDCAPVSKLPDGSQWVFELKLDGYRAIGVRTGSETILYSRNHKNFNKRFPQIADALDDLPADTVIDGEGQHFTIGDRQERKRPCRSGALVLLTNRRCCYRHPRRRNGAKSLRRDCREYYRQTRREIRWIARVCRLLWCRSRPCRWAGPIDLKRG